VSVWGMSPESNSGTLKHEGFEQRIRIFRIYNLVVEKYQSVRRAPM